MAEIRILSAGNPALLALQPAMRALIDAESCKLGVVNPGAYFTADNDYVLAFASGQLAALCVIKRRNLRHATYLGYLLAIVRPDQRRSGLMAKMWLYYFLRSLPRLSLATLRCWSHRLYIYADVGSPVVYAKLSQLKMPLYPDLVHGDSPQARALGARLREELVSGCDIRNMWQRPGLFRDVDFSSGIIQDYDDQPLRAEAHSRDEFHLDRHWHTRWHDYVPPQADLLTVIPMQLSGILRHFFSLVGFGLRPRWRRRAAAAARSQPVALTSV